MERVRALSEVSSAGRCHWPSCGPAMAELESSSISERVIAGMQAAKSRGKHLGQPQLPQYIIAEIVDLAASTGLSVRKTHEKIAEKPVAV